MELYEKHIKPINIQIDSIDNNIQIQQLAIANKQVINSFKTTILGI